MTTEQHVWARISARIGTADRPAAEAGVRAAYRQAGLPEPRAVVWCGSPLVGAAAALLLTTGVEGLAGPEAGWAVAEARRRLAAHGLAGVASAAGEQPRRPAPSVKEAVRARPWREARERLVARQGRAAWSERWTETSGETWPRLDRLARHIRVAVADGLAGRIAASEGADGSANGFADGAVNGFADAAAGSSADGFAHASADGAVNGSADGAVNGSANGFVDGAANGLADAAANGFAEGARTAVRLALYDAVPGQQDAIRLAGLADDPGLAGQVALARSAGWWWPYADVVVLAEVPAALELDASGRLHRADGPALAYADGFALHAWHGTPLSRALFERLDALTVDEIRAERSPSLRRVMLEHFGCARYLAAADAEEVHRDEAGVLWRVELPDDEPLVMVEVAEATPEPDGTPRVQWFRVPPTTRTALEGVAWTFGMPVEAYRPKSQS
ncbi:DUF6745 domain-containing protein [Streptacidiphilus jiangxiensis]|uniref:DUF6745 domain-containing protein n=1 Tax=Streptacidiphilus jiangxiensis TaxID=235985 RepID=A0A1H7S028_STRJI|nr:hypothetical protein [Streptacidiphilus jiangxiensis]SEL65931.1 hypothetical protein SAMN05414137_11178 [Streptacidiphilus jiangxiensis]